MFKIIISLVLTVLLLVGVYSFTNKSDTKVHKVQNEKKVPQESHPTVKKEINIPQEEVKKVEKTQPTLAPFMPKINTFKEDKQPKIDLNEIEIKAFKEIQPRISIAMQKMPDCLEAAQTKEEAFACSSTLRELNKQLAMALGDLSPETQDEAYEAGFIWDEKTKLDMIQEIESGTQAMQDMQECIETVETSEELENCLKPQ